MFDSLTDLLNDDGFRTALLLSGAATLVVGLVALVSRRSLPLAGAVFAAAALYAVDDRYGLESEVALGVALLAAGGYLATRWGPLAYLVAAVPGAWVLAGSPDLDQRTWAQPTVFATALVGGVLVAAFDRAHAAAGVPPVLLAVTVCGVYLTTPDTEHSTILVGAVLPLVVLCWPRPLASLGVGGALAAVAVVGWDVAIDGVGRDGAVVGGIACLGVMAIEPLVRLVTRRAPDTSIGHALVLTAVHVVVVVVCSRVGGLRSAAGEAAAICAVAWVAAAVVLALAPSRTGARA